MSRGEESSTPSPSATMEDAASSCSNSSGYHSAGAGDVVDGRARRQRKEQRRQQQVEEDDPAEDFVVVDLVQGQLQESPLRASRRRRPRWTSSIPRVRFSTSRPDQAVDIAMGESGLAAAEPITVGEMMQRTVVRVPQHVALRYKIRGSWRDVTYREYYSQCLSAAKSFLKLGVEPFQAVLIAGFNSLQWHVSALGAIFAGGLSCGVDPTIGKEELYRMARKVRAAVAVVEKHSLMTKFLQGKMEGKLPELKAIVQYTGPLADNHDNIYDWEQFMRLGSEMTTAEIEHMMSQTQANQCATLVYTSGTTGDPKVVMLSHDNLTWSAKSLMKSYRAIEFGAEQTVAYLPLSHIAAQMLDIYVSITVAATVNFAQPDALKGSLRQTLKEVRPTMFFGVPRVYGRMMESVQEACQEMGWAKKMVSGWAMKKGLEGNMNKQHNEPLPWGWTMANCVLFRRVQSELGFQRCKIFAVGGAITRTEVYHYLMSLNIPMMNFYGMSESCGAHCVNQSTENHWKVGSAGKNLMAVSTKLSDTDVHGEGEICFSGRHVFMGYLGDPGATSRAVDHQGWLRTGDIGHFDENGFLHVTGRTCEVIILRGGETILPLPIENRVLTELPFLSHVVVVGEKRPYLTCLMTLSCVMDRGEPTDQLAPLARRAVESLGSESTTVSGVITSRDKAVFTAITEGLDRANSLTPTNVQKIQKWTLLDRDFSIPGGELGLTLKVRRFIVHKKYASTIETLYET